jgi:GxxExxY protein
MRERRGAESAEEAEGCWSELTGEVIGGAIAVHRALGPGLLESAYAACLEAELTERGLTVRRQVRLPVRYRGRQVNCAYRVDMLVNDRLILELKSVEIVLSIHKAQLLSYLRLSNLRFGLLINFNVAILTHGIARIVNPDLSRASAPSADSVPLR